MARDERFGSLDARYAIGEVLGEGAMGRVFAARDRVLGREVAIKVPRASVPPPHGRQRILDEARASAHLHGEHVARVLDVGAADPPYIVMERLMGFDLDKMIEREGRIPLERAVAFVRQACDGLAEAHAAGIVHRDVKPSNLFLAFKHDGSCVVKVLDFGVADMGGAAQPTCAGTALYMAPEVVRGSRADVRCDVWSLGVVLHELVAGQPPFRGANTSQVFISVLSDVPERLDAIVPGAPWELAEVVQRCLSKTPEHRYANAAELSHALRAVEAVLAADTRSRLDSLAAAAAAVVDEQPSRTSHWPRWLFAAVVVAATGFFAGVRTRAMHASSFSPPDVRAKASLVSGAVSAERIVGHELITPRPPQRRPSPLRR